MNTAKKDSQNKSSFVFNAHRIEMKFQLKKNQTKQQQTNNIITLQKKHYQLIVMNTGMMWIKQLFDFSNA